MKILVNALPIAGLSTGIARYVRNLYTALKNDYQVEAHYFTGRHLLSEAPAPKAYSTWNNTYKRVERLPSLLALFLRSGYLGVFENRLRYMSNRNGFSLYHETDLVPARVPELPVVYSMYDLSLLHYAHTHPRERVLYYKCFTRRRLPQVAHVLTISEYMREEILAEFKLKPHRVTAIPLAADRNFYPRSAQQIQAVLKRLNLPSEYLLYTGTLEPRKNIQLIIKALPLMHHQIPLVLAGWSGWGEKNWLTLLQSCGLQHRVHTTGYVSEEDLAGLYSGATILIYPSLYEGFGLPVLEAMASGCPVIVSNSSCLPETAGNAALYVDPHDAAGLAHQVDRLLDDEALRAAYRQKGFQRAAEFTWRQTARRTLKVFQRVSNVSW